ncbi:MAG: tetratricopeptide repeat protein [Hyphomonadaceae bacterium]|nr:tetratricopeptide repeat protein [Hyphomonadaceae bacterium]
MLLKSRKPRRLSVGLAGLSAMALTLVLGACSDPMAPFSPSALAPAQPPATPQKQAGQSSQLQALAAAHGANPTDPGAALAYARALRTGGAKADALAVLEAAAKSKSADRRLALERGLIALELGEAQKAETLLRSAHDPKAPDWRLHSALGAALASRGKQQDAQAQFAKALALAPNNPSVLNNLALSYALDGKAGEAEKLLRTAAATKAGPDAGRVQQNLALVLGLGGKYAEARSAAEASLPVDKATANIAYLKTMAEARAATSTAADPAGHRKAASANLPPPTYQLGGPAEARK